MQQVICKNCEHIYQGKFCNYCGQKAHTEKLNLHFVIDEIKYTFLHINKGLLFTAKELFTRPGHTIREFIEGKRVNHYKPILLVFVLAGIEGLLNHYLPIKEMMGKVSPLSSSKQAKIPFKIDPYSVFEWTSSHYAILELLFIPLVSFCTWLAFKKWGYNYIENIILNCFLAGQRMIFGIIVFPIIYLCSGNYKLFIITSLLQFGTYGFSIWGLLQLYKDKNIGNFILRFLLFSVLLCIVFLVLFMIVFFAFLYYYNLL